MPNGLPDSAIRARAAGTGILGRGTGAVRAGLRAKGSLWRGPSRPLQGVRGPGMTPPGRGESKAVLPAPCSCLGVPLCPGQRVPPPGEGEPVSIHREAMCSGQMVTRARRGPEILAPKEGQDAQHPGCRAAARGDALDPFCPSCHVQEASRGAWLAELLWPIGPHSNPAAQREQSGSVLP